MDEIKTTEITASEANVEQDSIKAGEIAKVDYEAEAKRLREENEKLKKAQTNAAKDASDWKAKFRATQDEATRMAEEKQEILEQLRLENEMLKRNQTLAEHKAGWLGIGMAEDIAAKASEASVAGDFTALMDAIKEFITVHDKELNASALRQMPAPVSGGKTQGVTKEQFDKMGYAERNRVFNEFPDLYKEFTK